MPPKKGGRRKKIDEATGAKLQKKLKAATMGTPIGKLLKRYDKSRRAARCDSRSSRSQPSETPRSAIESEASAPQSQEIRHKRTIPPFNVLKESHEPITWNPALHDKVRVRGAASSRKW